MFHGKHPCPVCGKLKANVQAHMEAKHPKKPTEIKRVCPLCNRMVTNLQTHMADKHPASQQGLVQPPKPRVTQVKVGQVICNQHELACPECGNPMVLRPSQFGPGPYYACSTWPVCRGAHGAKHDGTPLGIPADQETRWDRIQAHDVFDQLWKRGHMGRWKAYAWMQRTLGLSPDKAHIGRFDSATCKQLILAVLNYLSTLDGDLGEDLGEDLKPSQTFEDIEKFL